jgi:exodeoxyribonuclease-5
VQGIGRVRRATVSIEIETDGGRWMTVPCVADQFGQELIKDHRDKKTCLFDFGYCLTAHKAQGSEWSSVVVLEEVAKIWDARRWRYTVATRAKERLVYCG